MSEEILDLPDFLERVQDDKELLLELLEIFTADYETKKVQLQDAADQKDAEQVRSITHSLKGASGNISAQRLRAVFLLIEEKGKNDDFEGMDALIERMNNEFEALSQRMAEVKADFS